MASHMIAPLLKELFGPRGTDAGCAHLVASPTKLIERRVAIAMLLILWRSQARLGGETPCRAVFDAPLLHSCVFSVTLRLFCSDSIFRHMELSPAQCRAARGLLGISQDRLVEL